MGDLVEKLHEKLGKNLYYHDVVLINNMWRDSGSCTRLDSEWNKVCFTLIMMAQDLGVEKFLYDKIVLQKMMT